MMDSLFDIAISSGRRALVNIKNFQLSPGKINFLFGESGIGKSLIAKTIYGLADPDELDIELNGQPYRHYLAREDLQLLRINSFFVFQEPSSHLNPLLTLGRQLDEGSLKNAEHDQEIMAALWQQVSPRVVEDILRVFPKPFRPSGGEKQRILLAMAFKKIYQRRADQHSLFVFDEPSGSLDDHYRNLFIDLLFEKFAASPFTVLFITHDYSIIGYIYKNHRKLVPYLATNELRHSGGLLVQQPFEARLYLDWIARNRDKLSAVKLKSSGRPVLEVDHSFQVFDRAFSVYSDAGHQKRCPLIIYPGHLAYLKAPSGTGKTTLAKIIIGLQRARRVRFRLAGMPFSEQSPRKKWQQQVWGRRATMVFQHADEALNSQATVAESFHGLPLQHGSGEGQILEFLKELFDEQVARSIIHKKVNLLSGGQKQRLNLLRSMVLQTDLIILDEPLNGLDFISIQRVLEIIRRKQKEDIGFLIISHNEEIFDSLIAEENTYYLGTE